MDEVDWVLSEALAKRSDRGWHLEDDGWCFGLGGSCHLRVSVELSQGQVAVVTRAASGIGLALTERFARSGLRQVMADVEDDALSAAAGRLREQGADVEPVRVDVSKESEVQKLAQQTLDRYRAVHVVCKHVA
jgi:hypothetical protein